jgi:hypothetical protein
MHYCAGNSPHYCSEQHMLSTDHNIRVLIVSFLNYSYSKLMSSSMLPMHWRYQQPTENQYYVTVALPKPTVLARCLGKERYFCTVQFNSTASLSSISLNSIYSHCLIPFSFLSMPDVFTPENHMQECLNELEVVQYPCNYSAVDMCDWFILKQNLNVSNLSGNTPWLALLYYLRAVHTWLTNN